MDRAKPTSGWRAAAWLLALFLLAFRLPYPAGYMPAWASGGFALVLCDGYSPAPQADDHGSGHHSSSGETPPETDPKNNCPYAAAASLSGFVAAAPFVPPAMPSELEQDRPLASQDSASRISERPRSRAPPEPVHVAI